MRSRRVFFKIRIGQFLRKLSRILDQQSERELTIITLPWTTILYVCNIIYGEKEYLNLSTRTLFT